MPQLTSTQVRELRARAHGLNPVVSIAENGLSDSVLKEIDTCLTAHELIKIRVYGDSWDNRLSYLATICQDLDAAAVQHIGKLLVVYRENPEKTAAASKKSAPQQAPARRTKRSFQS